MRIKSMRLIPLEDEDSPMDVTGPLDCESYIDWVRLFLQWIKLQYGPWPDEDAMHMQGLLETLAKCFELAGDTPGTYRSHYREMGGDGNYDVEITFVE